MTRISELLRIILETPDCHLLPVDALPQVTSPHILPDDVIEFYRLCGGCVLYEHSGYSSRIVSAKEFVLANIKYFGKASQEELASITDDISWSWYILVEANRIDYITIDCDPRKLGRCYESFWETYAMKGQSPIVSESFTDLLEHLILEKGHHWYWLRQGFRSLGDAYE